MSEKRKGLIQFKGADVTVIGADVELGQRAPEFKVQSQAWETFYGLSATRGKVRIIAAVPSLDTAVCDRETRRFNEAAVELSDEIAVLVVSMDLPFAQARWCGAAGIDQVSVLSDHRWAKFGKAYGCLMKEPRLLRRAVFVVDRQDRVVYVDYMPALGEEPDYEAVLAAARQALG